MNTKIAQAPIIGFVRYSQKISFVDSQKDIFEPEYFEYRYRIFVEVTLRSLQQQTNTNFVVIVLHSETIPLEYKKRFLNLENENSFLYNIFIKDTQESFEKAIADSQTYVSYKNDTAITFRIDNDDALQQDFIERLSDFHAPEFVNFALTFPMLYIIKRIAYKTYRLQEKYYPANSIGLAYVTSKKEYKTVFQIGQHHLINRETKMISMEANLYGGLQTINGENALNTMEDVHSVVLSEEKLQHFLNKKRIQNISIDCLKIYQDNKSKKIFSRTIRFFQLLIPPIFYRIISINKN